MNVTSTNDSTRSATGRIEIQASPERIWKALTDAAELERWFPLEARVEPGEGGSIYMSWMNEYAGESEILAWEPPRRLVVSWAWDDKGEHAPQVTEYRIESRGGTTVVRVVTSGFPDDPSWDDFVEGTTRGWAFELRSLKHYLEEHDGEDRAVVYVRRRAAVDRASAWERILGDEGLGARPLRGEVFDHSPPVQYAAVVPELDGGLLRISFEPCMGDTARRDVTLWLQAWGAAREGLPELEARWRPLLERLFPEGQTL